MTSIKQSTFKKLYNEAEELINRANEIIEVYNHTLFKVIDIKEDVSEELSYKVSNLSGNVEKLNIILNFLRNETHITCDEKLKQYSEDIKNIKNNLRIAQKMIESELDKNN